MRHIENSYKARVHIPSERSENKNVVVVGTEDAVAGASKHIWKLLEDEARVCVLCEERRDDSSCAVEVCSRAQ